MLSYQLLDSHLEGSACDRHEEIDFVHEAVDFQLEEL